MSEYEFLAFSTSNHKAINIGWKQIDFLFVQMKHVKNQCQCKLYEEQEIQRKKNHIDIMKRATTKKTDRTACGASRSL